MKRICILIFALLAICMAYSCTETEGPENNGTVDKDGPENNENVDKDEPENNENVDKDYVCIVENGKSLYRIIYASQGGEEARTNAEELATAIRFKTGVTLEVADDKSPVMEYEIILGSGNSRDECSVLDSGIGNLGYVVSRVGKKLVITGSDANHTVLALDYFVRTVLRNNAYSSQGFCKFTDAMAYTIDSEISQASLKNIAKYNLNYELSLTQVVKQASDGDVKVAQGVCCDGEHVYFVLKNSADSKARVYKYRMSDWSFVAKTDIFNGGHCNDLVWDVENKRVISIRGGVDSSIKEETMVIDPVSMTVSNGPNIPEGATAIDYNPVLKRFITRYGKNLCQRDLNMNIILKTQRNDNNNMTSQGMGSDDEYFYFPMSPKNGEKYNAILVYSWSSGSYKQTMTLPTTRESESMFEHNGVYYVNFYHGGAILYRIDVKLTFEASK